MLDRMTNCVYHYELAGQQKSVKGKALPQLDRDFDACARSTECKIEAHTPRSSGNCYWLSLTSVVSVVYQTYTYDPLGRRLSTDHQSLICRKPAIFYCVSSYTMTDIVSENMLLRNL